VIVLCEPWRAHPLAWIHRAEARAIAEELRRTGRAVTLAAYDAKSVELPSGPLLLRVSDPVMLEVARALSRASLPYIGPGATVMETCYDKYEAYHIASRSGVDCPTTVLASDAKGIPCPRVLKPRRGSDSIGLRILRDAPIPIHKRTKDYIVQQFVYGTELTVAVYRDCAGVPLRITLPEGTPYSFLHKYLLRPRCVPLTDTLLAQRVRAAALRIAAVFAPNWAARIDLIHESTTGRLYFLECDVAPLVGAKSAFAASFSGAGVGRPEQLRWLLEESPAQMRRKQILPVMPHIGVLNGRRSIAEASDGVPY
jgi:carbamoylphosphate synthase large subunit